MKKLYHVLPLSLLCFGFLFPGTGLAQLRPLAAESHEEMGREYIDLSSQGLRLELGFDGYHEGRMVFDLVVINESQDSTRVDPSSFYFVLLDDPEADTSLLPRRMALHPERVLGSYRDDLEQVRDRKEINTILGVLEAGIGFISSTTAFVRTEDPGFMLDAIFGTIGTAGHYIVSDQILSADVANMEEEAGIIASEIMRPVILPPGEAINGFVFFPPEDDPMYYMFCFPVEGREFQFVYLPPALQARADQ